MSEAVLIVVVGAITFASRASFMLRRSPFAATGGGRFLEVFPVALFVAFAVSGLVAPDGELAATPALAAGAGGIAGSLLFRRSVVGVVACGLAVYWLVRGYL